MIKNLINEQQLIKIVEERGVAASPWKKEIDAIAQYIRKYVREEVTKMFVTEMEFDIPRKISNVFSFLPGLTIHVTALYGYTNTNSGGGRFAPNKKGTITYNKWRDALENTQIDITCFYNIEGKVWLNSILTSFYHEINHAYDAWIDAHKTRTFRRFNTTAKKGNAGLDIVNAYPVIGTCIYRLFSETEYNALVASVFGDLQGRDSTLNSFQQDYKYTQAYNVYLYIKNGLDNEIDKLNADEARNILNTLRSQNISLNMKENKLTSFKIAFKAKANKLLNELLHDIGRTASYYYDKKYEEEIDNNGSPLAIN